ncbi:MAG: NADP-specific glutamate dehydrogenase [Candidatus Paceibacteria bacterium]
MTSTTDVLAALTAHLPHQPTFLQAVVEVFVTLEPYLKATGATKEDYERLLRLAIPERIIAFKVLWTNDQGAIEHNIGYRVQFNSALGSYKGGLRFDPTVNEDVLKFLGFEQIFKNALTGLPLGGGKGGSDFNPKGRSDSEIRSFCRAFMVELHHHIGVEIDVPAGDMGVGGREIGYMMGMYKELTHRSEGAMTGKDPLIGGSFGRTAATGHGVVYFARAMLREVGKTLVGLRCVVSGSGNVAEHTARKLVSEGAVVLTLSDRTGYLYKEAGLTISDIDAIIAHKDTGANLDTVAISGTTFIIGTPWQTVVADGYFPCATQNEIDEVDARVIASHAVLVVEGANMPLRNEAVAVLHDAHIAHAPGKASNAGGVAVSGLEMAQNAAHYPWSAEEVEAKLVAIMENIHELCKTEGKADWGIDYVRGANIAGAKRVLAAMKILGY